MNILYLLIPISFVLLALAVAGLVWSIRKGQYDDLDSPAHRILFDDDQHLMPTKSTKTNYPDNSKEQNNSKNKSTTND